MSTAPRKPRCPWCGKPMGFQESRVGDDNVCLHCGKLIVWSQQCYPSKRPWKWTKPI